MLLVTILNGHVSISDGSDSLYEENHSGLEGREFSQRIHECAAKAHVSTEQNGPTTTIALKPSEEGAFPAELTKLFQTTLGMKEKDCLSVFYGSDGSVSSASVASVETVAESPPPSGAPPIVLTIKVTTEFVEVSDSRVGVVYNESYPDTLLDPQFIAHNMQAKLPSALGVIVSVEDDDPTDEIATIRLSDDGSEREALKDSLEKDLGVPDWVLERIFGDCDPVVTEEDTAVDGVDVVGIGVDRVEIGGTDVVGVADAWFDIDAAPPAPLFDPLVVADEFATVKLGKFYTFLQLSGHPDVAYFGSLLERPLPEGWFKRLQVAEDVIPTPQEMVFLKLFFGVYYDIRAVRGIKDSVERGKALHGVARSLRDFFNSSEGRRCLVEFGGDRKATRSVILKLKSVALRQEMSAFFDEVWSFLYKRKY